MVFPNKTFNWPRHIAIAVILITFINLLVIFAPNILGIFGVIGRLCHVSLNFIAMIRAHYSQSFIFADSRQTLERKKKSL